MSNAGAGSEDGFTLLEMVCVLAIVGLISAVLLPSFPGQTSRSRLEAYAVEAATLLRSDRNAAIRQQSMVTTRVDAGARSMRSGATGASLRLPDDVTFEALLPQNCDSRPVVASVSFFASGMSCGGVIAFTRPDAGFEIRVNWLTGRIEVAPGARFASR
jgi:general secretion pathway protein H